MLQFDCFQITFDSAEKQTSTVKSWYTTADRDTVISKIRFITESA